MSTISRSTHAIALPAAILLASSGCADRISEPGLTPPAESAVRASAAVRGDATASVRWSAITRDLIAAKPAAAKPNQQVAFRAFAYLALAQYRATVAAEERPGIPPHASPQGAVAGPVREVVSRRPSSVKVLWC